MSEYENNLPDARHQGQNPAEPEMPDSLPTTILAHLGHLQEVPTQAPAWQKSVVDVQKLAEMCNRANVRLVVEALEKELEHPEKAVRMAAVRALGKVYLSFPGHVRWEIFMRALANPSPEVRATTIQTFMTFITAPDPQPPHPQAVERLVKRLSHMDGSGQAREDASVRLSIIQLMGLLGDLAPADALAEIVRIACNRKEDWPLREAAVLVLGSLYPRLSAEQRLQVNEVLYDTHPFVREVAINALRERVTVESVEEVLRTGEAKKQVYAAQVLSQWKGLYALRMLALDQHAASSARAAAILVLAQLAETQDIRLRNAELDSLEKERDFSIRTAAEMLREVIKTKKTLPDREEEIG